MDPVESEAEFQLLYFTTHETALISFFSTTGKYATGATNIYDCLPPFSAPVLPETTYIPDLKDQRAKHYI